MEIAVIIEGISDRKIAVQPWVYYKDVLAEGDMHIRIYHETLGAFLRPFDAMLLHEW